jgi:glycosyltransferase involved in cell wall biosynthesis
MHLLAAGLRELGVHIDLFYLGNPRRPGAIAKARRELQSRAADYDLTHAQFGSSCAFITSGCPGIKLLSLRGSDWHPYLGRNLSGLKASLLATTFSRLSMGRFDAIITMSNRMTRQVRAATGHERVYTIPDPIDLGHFYPRRPRQRLAPGNKAAVLFTTVSVSNALKRVSLARAAFDVARAQWPGLEFRVASGIRPEEMPSFVDACDVVLCTSTHEGWPNSVKEALACGVPFVATDVSDLAEIAQIHPTCRVCEPDPVALGTALCDVLSSPIDPSLPSAVAAMHVPTISERLAEVYSALLRRDDRVAGAVESTVRSGGLLRRPSDDGGSVRYLPVSTGNVRGWSPVGATPDFPQLSLAR